MKEYSLDSNENEGWITLRGRVVSRRIRKNCVNQRPVPASPANVSSFDFVGGLRTQAVTPDSTNHSSTQIVARRRIIGTRSSEPEEESSGTQNESDDDCGSVIANRGVWEGEDVPWLGCVCEKIHQRPSRVFWIQCEGACRAWYNVAVKCVGFDENQANRVSWTCPECCVNMGDELRLLLDLPVTLIYNILKFVAKPRERAAVVCHQMSTLCKATRHAVHNEPWADLWSLILDQEYTGVVTGQSPRSRKRRKRIASNNDGGVRAIEKIQQIHLFTCDRTDDAHMALAATLHDNSEPLTLKRLRNILAGPPFRVNRRSDRGRPFIVECCTADYVDEGVVLRCVRELVEVHHADVNVFTNDEAPFADRPALYFAIARAMPRVVGFLVGVGASVSVSVKGRFRLVSDLSKSLFGAYTPLEFATALREAESSENLPPYYLNKLKGCIRILSTQHEANTP